MGAGPAARTLFIGLDACDLHVAQDLAARGEMPAIAHLLAHGAVQETVGPLGFLVGANWPTIYTGTTPSRHQFLCSGQVRGGTYESRWLRPLESPLPVWQHVSGAGGRVAVFDAPHAAAAPVNGVQLVEWGCHDRHAGTKSFPESLLDDIEQRHGSHLIGELRVPFPHAAPCDVAHRAGAHRTRAEHGALLDDLLESIRRKQAVNLEFLEQGGWDLFFTVFGESHCAGHQFWKLHDPTHPWHEPEERRALGDPLVSVYRALDRSVGELIARVGADATVYVHLSHGMRAHFDGTCLIEPVLWRLDQYASGLSPVGGITRATDRLVSSVPRAQRVAALRGLTALRRAGSFVAYPPTDVLGLGIPQWVGQRRWWMQPNDSAFAAIRLNIEGREPNGRIVASRARDVALWLADRLLELVNVDTGRPSVDALYLADDHYERVVGDPMGDLIVDWNRTGPIDTVWSPATGIVSVPYGDWRTGDHHTGGLLLARGAGIPPGRRPEPMSVVHIAPTLSASLGVEVDSYDGVARADLLPERVRAMRAMRAMPPVETSPPTLHPVEPRGARQWRAAFDIPLAGWVEEYAIGLSRVIHEQHLEIQSLRNRVVELQSDIDDLDARARIGEVAAWLRTAEVPESTLVSIVMPTRNRRQLLERAVASVQALTYRNWELLVVDDASTDGTDEWLAAAARADARIRVFRFASRQRSSRARNHALENVKGDIVTYLDDDNRFDPDWLRAVAWAFTEFRDVDVCYGARVIDDDVRHRGRAGRSLPVVQLNRWDRAAMLRSNLVDQNTIAHRPSPVRFDETIDHFSDWDLLLQLTDDCDPLVLPALAVHYHSDAQGRLSDRFGDELFVTTEMDRIRARTIARRDRL